MIFFFNIEEFFLKVTIIERPAVHFKQNIYEQNLN